MEKFFILFLFFYVFTNVSSQGLSEGEIYMQKYAKEDSINQIKFDNKHSKKTHKTQLIFHNSNETGNNEQIESYETVIIDHLFTSLTFEEMKNRAKSENKAYYIDFTADWCAPCKMMDKTTFRDYNVVKFTHQNYYAIQLDVSDFDAIEMQAMYEVNSLPSILFFNSEGELIGRSTGLQTGTLFYKKLQEIKTLL